MKGVQSGMSICAAANEYGIKYTTARNILDHWRATGSLYKHEKPPADYLPPTQKQPKRQLTISLNLPADT